MENPNPGHDVNSTSTICAIVLDSFGNAVENASVGVMMAQNGRVLAEGNTDDRGQVNITCQQTWDTITIIIPEEDQAKKKHHKK